MAILPMVMDVIIYVKKKAVPQTVNVLMDNIVRDIMKKGVIDDENENEAESEMATVLLSLIEHETHHEAEVMIRIETLLKILLKKNVND